MLSADGVRNMLAAVFWVCRIAEVGYTTLKQCCTDCEWLQSDAGGGNPFKLRPVLGGHNFH